MAADMRRATGPATAISSNDAGSALRALLEAHPRVLPPCSPRSRGGRGRRPDDVSPGPPSPGQRHDAGARVRVASYDREERLSRTEAHRGAESRRNRGRPRHVPSAWRRRREERLRGLGEALARMPETQRRALLMREWQGLSSAEVASQMGMSAPATYALLTRARRSLADALTTVKGRSALGLNVWPLLLRLKGLFAGGTAKVATTAAAAVAVAASGVADRVERSWNARTGRPSSSRTPRVDDDGARSPPLQHRPR